MKLSNRITRRSLLRGAGTLVALPFLDAMIPPFQAYAQSKAAPPIRTAFLYVPNGMVMEEWVPPGADLGASAIPDGLGRTSRLLLPHRENLTMISQLACANAN